MAISTEELEQDPKLWEALAARFAPLDRCPCPYCAKMRAAREKHPKPEPRGWRGRKK